MILYITLGNMIAPVVVLMTFFGFAGWFLGEPQLFQIQDMITFFWRFFLTVGFLIMGFIALYRMKLLREFPYLIAGAFTIGLILAVANSVAFTKALLNRKLSWFCTPKVANEE